MSRTPAHSVSEFDLIGRYFTHATRHTQLGVGDDAALVRPRAGTEIAISTDLLLAGRHFFRGADPGLLGHKALAVNLSDMAAMGATPRWATLSIALPAVDARWLGAFARGFMRLAQRHGVDLIGGDTTRGPLAICVQIMGEVPRGKALRRDGAQVGDEIWVSGELGGAALALAGLQRRVRLTPAERRPLERRLHQPTARIELGAALRGIARSAIDVSDGLLADLGHICERSQTGAVVEFARVPAPRAVRARLAGVSGRTVLLAGGDDYELCFTAPVARHARVKAIGQRVGVPVSCIGRIVAAPRRGARVVVQDGTGAPVVLRSRGFDHFGA